MTTVEVLGPGCPKCTKLAEAVERVSRENGLRVELVKVTDMSDILARGVMMVPGLVVNGTVRASGKVPGDGELLAMLRE